MRVLPPPYGRRTSGVRALWVVANPSVLHPDHMTGTTTVATFVSGAVGFHGPLRQCPASRWCISSKDSPKGEKDETVRSDVVRTRSWSHEGSSIVTPRA